MKANMVLPFIITMLVITISYMLIEIAVFISNSVIELSPVLHVSTNETILIRLPKVKKYDRVYLVVDGYTNIDEIRLSPIEAFQLPLKVETFEHDVFPTLINEKRYLFIVSEDSENAFIQLRLQPLVPYIVKNVEGYQRYSILSNCSRDMICVRLSPVRFHDNNYTQIMFIHPYKQVAEPNFRIRGMVKVLQCKVDYVNIVVMSEKNWYAYKVVDPFTPPGTTVSFEIDAYTTDIFGIQGGFLGENLVAISVSVGMSRATHEECPYSVIGIGELVIHNGNSEHRVKPIVQNSYTLNPRIYVLRKFNPSNNYIASVTSLTILLTSLALLIIRITKEV